MKLIVGSVGAAVAFVAILACTGSAFVAYMKATPHQIGSPFNANVKSKQKYKMKMMMDDFDSELDNMSIQRDESIVAARKCAVCIG